MACFDQTPKSDSICPTWFDLVINPDVENYEIGKTYVLQLLKEPPRAMPKRDEKGKFVKSVHEPAAPSVQELAAQFIPKTTYKECFCFYCLAAKGGAENV